MRVSWWKRPCGWSGEPAMSPRRSLTTKVSPSRTLIDSEVTAMSFDDRVRECNRVGGHAASPLELRTASAQASSVAELPAGTVTFLFTDVEGSTRLLQELGDEYAEVLAAHRRALREAFERHGGVEVDTQGDAFFVAFVRASDALAAAADGAAALEPGPIRVRMGVHTGEPVVTDEGYVGLDVHRAARIASAGYGGQIL